MNCTRDSTATTAMVKTEVWDKVKALQLLGRKQGHLQHVLAHTFGSNCAGARVHGQ